MTTISQGRPRHRLSVWGRTDQKQKDATVCHSYHVALGGCVADAGGVTSNYGENPCPSGIQEGIAQLSGFAKAPGERTRAGEIARSVEGVAVVHNNLVVAP